MIIPWKTPVTKSDIFFIRFVKTSTHFNNIIDKLLSVTDALLGLKAIRFGLKACMYNTR